MMFPDEKDNPERFKSLKEKISAAINERITPQLKALFEASNLDLPIDYPFNTTVADFGSERKLDVPVITETAPNGNAIPLELQEFYKDCYNAAIAAYD